jgi:hypothetical protein
MAMVFGGSIRFSTAAFRSGEYPTVFDTPMFVNACALYRWAHKVRDKFRGQYSVSGIE